MPEERLIRSFLLPELILFRSYLIPNSRTLVAECGVGREPKPCPRCAAMSASTYDHRWITAKDESMRTWTVRLRVRKRRLWCRGCRRPFTETVGGIRHRSRHTERYGRALLRACERYVDLKHVRRDFRCSAGFLYGTLYRHLELERRKRLYPWPSIVGLDEHCFGRRKPLMPRQFVSMVVDQKNHRLFELVQGRTQAEMESSLAHIPGRDNVRFVTIDMCDPYKNFVRNFFPNARIVADKFHVLRLLTPALTRRRIEITGDKRSLAIRRQLLCNGNRLDFWQRLGVREWLKPHPELREIYDAKEALHAFYRTKGIDRACKAFLRLVARLQDSTLPELATLLRTLLRWQREILAHFDSGLTNAMTEGFNNKAKLVKRRAFGYRSFRNYRLRLLNACAH